MRVAVRWSSCCCRTRQGCPPASHSHRRVPTQPWRAAKHLDPKYVCPMHPQIVRDEPGSCPICGMDLVARTVDAAASGRPAVEISNAVINSMGCAPWRRATRPCGSTSRRWAESSTTKTRLTHVHPRRGLDGAAQPSGRRRSGQQGQVIGSLYSPDILSAQVDFLIAPRPDEQQSPVRERAQPPAPARCHRRHHFRDPEEPGIAEHRACGGQRQRRGHPARGAPGMYVKPRWRSSRSPT